MGCGSSKTQPKHSSLCDAAKAGNKQTVRMLLEKEKTDPNSKVLTPDHGWRNPLYIAVESNHKDIVQMLLKAGADPNEVLNNERITPLMKAAWRNNKECTQLLIKHGAKVNETDIDGDSALHYCAVKNSSACMKLLLARKARVNVLNKKLQTPLHQACHVGSVECVKLLVKNGAGLKITDKVGLTPAELAALKDQHSVLDYLVPLLD